MKGGNTNETGMEETTDKPLVLGGDGWRCADSDGSESRNVYQLAGVM